MPIYTYLDLSTAHLTESEMQSIADVPMRVIEHDYGVMVHVPDLEFWDGQHEDDIKDFISCWPNLAAILLCAHVRGCEWVNFDCDGELEEGLPTYDW